MPNAKALASLAALLSISACNATTPPAPLTDAQPAEIAPLAEFAEDLKQRSCPDAAKYVSPLAIEITATPITLAEGVTADFEGATFAAGWHLTSNEPNLGGLSGLAIAPETSDLLAVSDAGAFIAIKMEAGVPTGEGSISYMRDQRGRTLQGKTGADSEGLALADGLALVSFERENRVLAFDLENCGSAARGALLADISLTPPGLGRNIPNNKGPEALALYPDGVLRAGLEVPLKDQAVIGEISLGVTMFDERIARTTNGLLTGMDALDGVIYSVFRDFSPLFGNRILLTAHTPEGTPQTLADLAKPFPVDNFEGIAATRLEDGTVRLYIISDDNFSERQRTLLLAFDVTLSAP